MIERRQPSSSFSGQGTGTRRNGSSANENRRPSVGGASVGRGEPEAQSGEARAGRARGPRSRAGANEKGTWRS